MPKVYRFTYFNPRRDRNSPLRIHELRDGAAFSEIAAVLTDEHGYSYGGLLFNYPPERPGDRDIMTMDAVSFESDDVLVITTRPPLKYLEQAYVREGQDRSGVFKNWREFLKPERLAEVIEALPDFRGLMPKKVVEPGRTGIEFEIAYLLHEYFQELSREKAVLTKPVIIKFLEELVDSKRPIELAGRADVVFRQRGDPQGSILNYNPHPLDPVPKRVPVKTDDRRPTTAYLLHLAESWPGGPRLIVSFSISGPATLVWNYMVRTKFTHLLDEPCFAMAEIEQLEIPKRTHDLSFAENWKVDILFKMTPLPS